MLRWVTVAALCCAAGAAWGQPKDDVDPWTDQLLTTEITTLCASPFKIEEASKAFQDPKWMREIGCVNAPAGLSITMIEPNYLTSAFRHGSGRPWRVRVTMPNGEAATLYTRPGELALRDGRRVPSRFW